LIPYWKLKREVARLGEQLAALPRLAYEPLYQIFYDRSLATRVKLHSGRVSAGDRIAVFLLYQPRGIQRSIQITLNHLIECGMAPMVVSNCPLSDADRAQLRERSWLTVERPNFGYDFGGYRDAVWLIRQSKVACKTLLFLNDSVWFPIFRESTMLRQMLESDSSYLGTQAFGKTMEDGSFDGFFGSYCFMIKQPLIDTDAFNHYWNRYRLSSSKEIVLRRGERQFSREMLKTGTKFRAIYPVERFAQIINQMNIDEIRQALDELVVFDGERLATKRRLQQASENDGDWLAHARRLIIDTSQSKNFIGSSPVVSINRLGFPMIKKNNEMLYRQARATIVDAINADRVFGFDPIIEEELRSKVATDSLRR
jgi:hypothetical protein